MCLCEWMCVSPQKFLNIFMVADNDLYEVAQSRTVERQQQQRNDLKYCNVKH